jgi:dipeptidase
MWFGLNEANRNCFMPVHVGISEMPDTLDHGDYLHVDFDSAWWVFHLVCETIRRRHDVMIKNVHMLQDHLDQDSFSLLTQTEERAWQEWRSGRYADCVRTLTQFAAKRTETIVEAWTNLWAKLEVKYLKNYLVDDEGNLTEMGYPVDWLKGVGYPNGPTRYYTLPRFR